MYIRSKDKKTLINMNNVSAIYVDGYNIFADMNNNCYLIEDCETKEEAIKTLDYIQEKLIIEETIEL